MIGFYIDKDVFVNNILNNKLFNSNEKVTGSEAREELFKVLDNSSIIFEPDYIPYKTKKPVEQYDFDTEQWHIDRRSSISKDINDIITIKSIDNSGQRYKIIVEGLEL